MKGAVLLVAAVVTGCANDSSELPRVQAKGSLAVSSTAFDAGSSIPPAYTCDGDGASPPVAWKGAKDAGEYALTVTDPDAPGGTFVHWVVWSLPGSSSELEAGRLPAGAVEGDNGFGDASYGGPCPPKGDAPHRYVFTVYALEPGATDGLKAGAGIEDLLSAISCCTIAEGQLTGTYGR